MNIILLGPPGSGKGTQAQLIVKKFNYFQLSTGDILRSEIKKKTEIGNKIENIISNGKFVSDQIVANLIKQSLNNLINRNRIIFDGYPRNVNQAKKIISLMNEFNEKISAVIFLNVSRDIVQKRILGRMICEKCNITLNEFFNFDEIANHPCGKDFLKKRVDDDEKIVMLRYDTYMRETKPVLDYYSNQKNFYEVDGSLNIEKISSKIINIINV